MTFKTRLIARLDVKGENLIKGVHLEGLRKIGNPNEFATKYYEDGVDEILFMDSVASLYGRNNLVDVVKKASKDIFIPLTVGGGIRKIEDADLILRNGADKIAVNTAAVERPQFISELAERYGSSCIVLSIEAKKKSNEGWEVFTHNGREKTGLEVINWIKRSISLGVGEILLTSVDTEGTGSGFDYDLVSQISTACKVPLIISGGFGKEEHIQTLCKNNSIDAIAVARALHYGIMKSKEIKNIITKYSNVK